MTEQSTSFRGVKALTKTGRRLEHLLIANAVCMLVIAFAYELYNNVVVFDTLITILILCLGILLMIIASFYKRMRLAKLIYDNRIKYFYRAQIVSTPTILHTGKGLRSNHVVIISCFGVLIDTTGVKFNMDGVHLKSIELNENHITMTYGKGHKNETMRINHETLSFQEVIRIVETFRYETGVIPVLVDDK